MSEVSVDQFNGRTIRLLGGPTAPIDCTVAGPKLVFRTVGPGLTKVLFCVWEFSPKVPAALMQAVGSLSSFSGSFGDLQNAFAANAFPQVPSMVFNKQQLVSFIPGTDVGVNITTPASVPATAIISMYGFTY